MKSIICIIILYNFLSYEKYKRLIQLNIVSSHYTTQRESIKLSQLQNAFCLHQFINVFNLIIVKLDSNIYNLIHNIERLNSLIHLGDFFKLCARSHIKV